MKKGKTILYSLHLVYRSRSKKYLKTIEKEALKLLKDKGIPPAHYYEEEEIE